MKSPRNVVVVSDLHAGCRMGLHPDRELLLHGGMVSKPSQNQQKVWTHWRYFWDEFVPRVTKKEPFVLVINGDALEGQPSGAKTPISLNTDDQLVIAEACIKPQMRKAAALYMTTGTENHVGKSAENERTLARMLGAVPDDNGEHARDAIWMDLHGHLVHFAHHVGTTSSTAYETTAPHREYAEFCARAARWNRRPPQLIVRSHRHSYVRPMVMSAAGESGSVVTPGWQLKTPFAGRLVQGRAGEPQIGGVVLRVGSRMGLYTAAYVYEMERPTEVTLA